MAKADRRYERSKENSVLIIDDELESLRGLIEYFKQNKWKVVTAVDEREAILEFEHSNPCLILLDLVLEKESGFEVLSQIRQLDPGSRIIMISKYFDHELIKQAMKAGAMGFMQKGDADRLPSGFTSMLKGALAQPQCA
jgi:DNA-binding NtrC family response regulator